MIKNINQTWAILRVLVVCFLFISFLSSSFHVPARATKNQALSTYVKKVNGPSHPDSGNPMEDQENEAEGRWEDRSESHVLFIQDFQQALLLSLYIYELKGVVLPVQTTCPVQGLPLYLANRRLLI